MTDAQKQIERERAAIETCEAVMAGTLHVDREALRIVLGMARDNYAAKVITETHRIVAEARAMEAPHSYSPAYESRPTGSVRTGVCRVCGRQAADALHSLDASKTPHLYVGRSGGTCYLCPHPRDHDIHPNRGTP